jgi:hypothetical protein
MRDSGIASVLLRVTWGTFRFAARPPILKVRRQCPKEGGWGRLGPAAERSRLPTPPT